MTLSDIEETRKAASDAFKRHDYDLALSLSIELSRYNVPEALFTCGLIYERLKGKMDLEKSYTYYDRLRKYDLVEGSNGCVRVILKKGAHSEAAKAEQYCLMAMKEDGSPLARLLLGRVLEELCQPPDLHRAKKLYLEAALHGRPWGYRRFANIKIREGHKVVGILIHIITTLIFPFYVLILGNKALQAG
ncbi:MAG TPA: hypothetical protein VN693_02295 [Rhodanobacteraceae bacterium]|nr:hypothetical protein [Rhodanobacteraceae bacterium]